jgi:hypothetical protein
MKWWERKWYWALCAILPFLCAPLVPRFVEGADPMRIIIALIPYSAGALFVYFHWVRPYSRGQLRQSTRGERHGQA